MKAFLIGFLGVIVGIFVFLLFLYLLIRSIMNRCGFRGKSFWSLYQEIKNVEARERTKHKQVSSMNRVLLPVILRDFKEFDENVFYQKTEETIRTVLDGIEKRNDKNLRNDDYLLIREKLSLQIQDLLENNTEKRYDDIIFHKHAIKSYKNLKGMVKLEVSSSLEYYYEEKKNGKIVVPGKYKKQTRYTTTFVYVYDTKKAGFDFQVLGVTCPSCGGPLSDLKAKKCPYCQSGIHFQVANLVKSWKVIDLKEDD